MPRCLLSARPAAAFRRVDQRQIIGEERLTDRSVARIVKDWVHKLAMLRGKSETEGDELVMLFSGYSLISGWSFTKFGYCSQVPTLLILRAMVLVLP
jgi:hypothetical protein